MVSGYINIIIETLFTPLHLPVPSSLTPMLPTKTLSFALFILNSSLLAAPAFALPGQTRQEVAAWIRSNPSLTPVLGDGLTVRRFNTATQRFLFNASVLPVTSMFDVSDNSNIIRREQISFYDVINGISTDRLEESLRVIYGADIYQDYFLARVIYQYPSPEQVALAQRQNLPLLSARRGELRLGDRFGYWLETTRGNNETGANGQITIFLREDLDQLESELRNNNN
jgi:hypothetical protein